MIESRRLSLCIATQKGGKNILVKYLWMQLMRGTLARRQMCHSVWGAKVKTNLTSRVPGVSINIGEVPCQMVLLFRVTTQRKHTIFDFAFRITRLIAQILENHRTIAARNISHSLKTYGRAVIQGQRCC